MASFAKDREFDRRAMSGGASGGVVVVVCRG
jgi:hypothetical protein